MGLGRWIGGLLGWVSFGPIGALIGYILGAVLEGDDSPRPSQRRASGSYSATEQRNSFLVSLLVLSSAVIKADGRILQSELDHVRSFIRANFGEGAVPEAMRILQELNGKNIDINEVGGQIGRYMNYSQRLQLFHYLAQLAMADGEFSKSEKQMLERIAAVIGLSAADANSVIAMFYKDTDAAYAVLEIEKTATDDEVRRAYRRMAMKYHPDKVASLGADVQKSAGEKFRQVKDAYEAIKAERGMS